MRKGTYRSFQWSTIAVTLSKLYECALAGKLDCYTTLRDLGYLRYLRNVISTFVRLIFQDDFRGDICHCRQMFWTDEGINVLATLSTSLRHSRVFLCLVSLAIMFFPSALSRRCSRFFSYDLSKSVLFWSVIFSIFSSERQCRFQMYSDSKYARYRPDAFLWYKQMLKNFKTVDLPRHRRERSRLWLWKCWRGHGGAPQSTDQCTHLQRKINPMERPIVGLVSKFTNWMSCVQRLCASRLHVCLSPFPTAPFVSLALRGLLQIHTSSLHIRSTSQRMRSAYRILPYLWQTATCADSIYPYEIWDGPCTRSTHLCDCLTSNYWNYQAIPTNHFRTCKCGLVVHLLFAIVNGEIPCRACILVRMLFEGLRALGPTLALEDQRSIIALGMLKSEFRVGGYI